MFGVLNIHKPTGCTSRDVVNQVQRIVRPVKVGHAGTLDPLASGVLLVCLGPATRLVEYAHQLSKSYHGTFLLGCTSESDDTETEITEIAGAAVPTGAAIDAAIHRFIGQISQRPPAYSAVKVQGKRAYKLARRGKSVELTEKPVTVHSLGVINYRYPELTLDIRCSSGTYIRSLGRDLAAALGTAAVMSALVRTAIGPFRLEDALPLDALTASSLAEHVQSPLLLLDAIPNVTLSDNEVVDVCHGLSVPRVAEAGEVAGIDATGTLVAILISDGAGSLQPRRVFRTELCS